MKRSLVFSLLLIIASTAWSQGTPVDPSKDRRAEPPGAPVSNGELTSSGKVESRVADSAASGAAKVASTSPAYQKLIKELMQVTHADKNQEAVIDQIASSVSKDAKEPTKAKKTAYDYFYKIFSVDALLPEISETYAKYFSQAELKKLIAFYKSPLGEKAASKMPEITRELMMKNQGKMQTKMSDFNKEKTNLEGFK